MNNRCPMAICAVAIILAAHSGATPGSGDQQVTVQRFVIDGANSLSSSKIDEVKAAVMGRRERGEALMDTARHLLTEALNADCYIRADIDLTIVNATSSPDSAWMQATVKQGVRYRLRNFRVQWAQAFSAQELGQQLPLEAMRRGDCSGLSNVEATLTDFYRSRGFRNVKVNSLVQPNKATEQFDLTLYIDERK